MLALFDAAMGSSSSLAEGAADGASPPEGPLRKWVHGGGGGTQKSPTYLKKSRLSFRHFSNLWVEKAQVPLNLQEKSDDELRAWHRGANSDASVRTYRKEDGSMGGGGGGGHMMGGGGGGGGPPMMMRGGRGRGDPRGMSRGGGRGGYDRHRSMMDDEEGGGGPRGGPGGRGRVAYDRSLSDRGGGGGWFDRGGGGSSSGGGGGGGGPPPGMGPGGGPGGPGDEALNGFSPRKGYTRAPFDDWRKPVDRGDRDEDDGGGSGWRGGGGGGGGRGRWNAGGWRDDGGGGSFRRYYDHRGDHYVMNGSSAGSSSSGPVNPRWKEPAGETSGGAFRTSRGAPPPGGGRGGHHGSSYGARSRYGRQDSDTLPLPEWAQDDVSDRDRGAGGTFDSTGKFQVDRGGRDREGGGGGGGREGRGARHNGGEDEYEDVSAELLQFFLGGG